jgi:pyruvate,orthophosphate dikinase
VTSAKEQSLRVLRDQGLPVPPWFSIEPGEATTISGAELAGRLAELTSQERGSSDQGSPDRGNPDQGSPDRGSPGRVSVRSGAAVSMPGMMTTLLDVAPDDLESAVRTVAASWDSPRAVTYRELHGIGHDLGTSVIVQTMVYGDRDDRSCSGVAFSRDPNTGEPEMFGEVAWRAKGEVVVAGESPTRPLTELTADVRDRLRDALARLEAHYRDACHVEFTVESGVLWLLQARPGGLAGPAAVRVAVDLVDAGVIGRAEAVRRASRYVRSDRTKVISRTGDGPDVIARGRGASPGVATGRIAVTADQAARMAVFGPVVLIRPHTSPLDMHGLAACAGVVTVRGGPTSHAAVVARSLGKPAVVQAGLSVEVQTAGVRADGRAFPEGTVVTVDGSSGEIVLGRAPVTTVAETDHFRRLTEWSTRPAEGSRSDRADGPH